MGVALLVVAVKDANERMLFHIEQLCNLKLASPSKSLSIFVQDLRGDAACSHSLRDTDKYLAIQTSILRKFHYLET